MFRTLGFALVILLFPLVTLAQVPAPLIANIEHRKTISLNGDWHAIVDMYDSGYNGYRGPVDPKSTFFANAKPKTKRDLVEYDFEKSATLKVPGDWNSQWPQLFFYEGTVWYERTFEYHPNSQHRIFLYVGGANYESRLGVNGTIVCAHQGGFTPFNCEVTSQLRDGQNFVVISVNAKRQRDAVPTVMTDWWNYGGLTRDVQLVEVQQQYVQNYSLQLEKGSPQRITGWVQLGTHLPRESSPTETKPIPVTISIPELDLTKTGQTDASGRAVFDIPVTGLKLWSPEQPKLYTVRISIPSDSIEDEIGFRTIEVRGKDILLNGNPVFLRGVSIHEEAPFRSGRAYNDDDAKALLGWVKELGGNFVRLAHYPHNEHMLRMADRMGLMVWSEVPVYWGIDWENVATLANAKNQLSESITRDRNRASVVIWSVGNETPVTDPRTKFMREMVKAARSLDSTRLISAALQVQHTNGSTRVIDDPLGEDLDVLGCNEYIGWYEGTAEDADKAEWKTPYNKPLVMSEFGADAKYAFHADSDTRFSEEFQQNVYEHQLKMLSRIDFLRGTSPWILMDFRSPRRLLPGIQDYYNRKGLVSDKGEKKKAFYVLQKWYQEKSTR
jgi:beta-glucuronidase